jgi:hypothetical protein
MSMNFGETTQTNSTDGFQISVILKEGKLGLSWKQAGATSEFLGELLATHSAKSGHDYSEARHAIIYMVNELLENAIKFHSPGDIEVRCSIEHSTFELAVINRIAPDMVPGFQGLLAELTAGDPGDLLIERIEANAADETSSGSGLGILTLMNDYGVRMGWHFSDAPSGGAIVIRTHASLSLN